MYVCARTDIYPHTTYIILYYIVGWSLHIQCMMQKLIYIWSTYIQLSQNICIASAVMSCSCGYTNSESTQQNRSMTKKEPLSYRLLYGGAGKTVSYDCLLQWLGLFTHYTFSSKKTEKFIRATMHMMRRNEAKGLLYHQWGWYTSQQIKWLRKDATIPDLSSNINVIIKQFLC
jgi:hypothetical protein